MKNKKGINSRPKIRTKAEEEKIQPRHIRAFAHFFKNYMSLSSVVTAALPIPITALGVLPTFQAHTKILSTYTSLFCFLILAFVFYRRHRLAWFMFPHYIRQFMPHPRRYSVWIVRWLPAFFIVTTLICILVYHGFLGDTLNKIGTSADSLATNDKAAILGTPFYLIPWENNVVLIVSYLGIFISAVSAFAMMAVREYLQDRLNISEQELVLGTPRLKRKV